MKILKHENLEKIQKKLKLLEMASRHSNIKKATLYYSKSNESEDLTITDAIRDINDFINELYTYDGGCNND